MPISWTESPSPRTCEVTSTIDQLLSHLHHSQQPGYPPVFDKRSNCAFRFLDSRRSNGRRSSLDCSSTSITRHVVFFVAFTQPYACSSAISLPDHALPDAKFCHAADFFGNDVHGLTSFAVRHTKTLAGSESRHRSSEGAADASLQLLASWYYAKASARGRVSLTETSYLVQ